MGRKYTQRQREAMRLRAEQQKANTRARKTKKKTLEEKRAAMEIEKRKERVPLWGPASKAPALFSDDRYKGPLSRVRRKSGVRDEDDWKPKGKGLETQFRSYVRHRLAKYRTPVFLYQTAHLEAEGPFELFCQIAAGASLAKAVKNGQMPVPFTKRMCNNFLSHGAKVPFYEAVRRTQVRAYEGPPALAGAIASTRLGDQFMDDEGFWDSVIRWLCKHPDIEMTQVGPLVDYFQFCRQADPDYSMKGRTMSATMRRMEAWHDELAKAKAATGEVFEPSGFQPGIWEFRRRHSSFPGQVLRDVWTVEEILTARDLATEGRSQKHCVYGYSYAIRSGRTSIWSMQSDLEFFNKPERHLTIEVMNHARSIVQARGKYNQMPTPKEEDVLTRWASENNLTVRTRRW